MLTVGALALPSGQQNVSYAQGQQRPGPSQAILAMADTQVRPTAPASAKGSNTGLLSRLQPFAPVAGAIVALMALIGTTFQYLRDRKRDRELRIEEGIAESTNKLTAFPGDPEMGIGTVVAALRNLRGFVSRSRNMTALKADIMEILATVTREDIDYCNSRHARFDSLCFQYWDDYKNYQRKNPVENIYILDKYLEALEDLERKAGIVRSANFTSSGIRNIPHAKNLEISHLTRLAAGYGLRLASLPPDQAQEAEQRFFKATGENASLRDWMLSSAKEDKVRLYADVGPGNSVSRAAVMRC
jgi:hypothetical protein